MEREKIKPQEGAATDLITSRMSTRIRTGVPLRCRDRTLVDSHRGVSNRITSNQIWATSNLNVRSINRLKELYLDVSDLHIPGGLGSAVGTIPQYNQGAYYPSQQ